MTHNGHRGVHRHHCLSPIEGTLNKVPVNGGAIETLAHGLNFPERLALDNTHGYWTEKAQGMEGMGAIGRVALSGGDAEMVVEGLTGPLDIEVDGSHIYWTENGPVGVAFVGSVRRIRK